MWNVLVLYGDPIYNFIYIYIVIQQSGVCVFVHASIRKNLIYKHVLAVPQDLQKQLYMDTLLLEYNVVWVRVRLDSVTIYTCVQFSRTKETHCKLIFDNIWNSYTVVSYIITSYDPHCAFMLKMIATI